MCRHVSTAVRTAGGVEGHISGSGESASPRARASSSVRPFFRVRLTVRTKVKGTFVIIWSCAVSQYPITVLIGHTLSSRGRYILTFTSWCWSSSKDAGSYISHFATNGAFHRNEQQQLDPCLVTAHFFQMTCPWPPNTGCFFKM